MVGCAAEAQLTQSWLRELCTSVRYVHTQEWTLTFVMKFVFKPISNFVP